MLSYYEPKLLEPLTVFLCDHDKQRGIGVTYRPIDCIITISDEYTGKYDWKYRTISWKNKEGNAVITPMFPTDSNDLKWMTLQYRAINLAFDLCELHRIYFHEVDDLLSTCAPKFISCAKDVKEVSFISDEISNFLSIKTELMALAKKHIDQYNKERSSYSSLMTVRSPTDVGEGFTVSVAEKEVIIHDTRNMAKINIVIDESNSNSIITSVEHAGRISKAYITCSNDSLLCKVEKVLLPMLETMGIIYNHEDELCGLIEATTSKYHTFIHTSGAHKWGSLGYQLSAFGNILIEQGSK